MIPHILVCEDDESILDVLQLILEEKGYRVTAWGYCNSIEDVRIIQPDLLLIDLWLPELGGVEICRLMKADIEMKDVPVILVSATNELEKTAKQLNADDFIKKPFNVKDVVSKVELHLERGGKLLQK
jgi:DNA-binding response OmpR family regulator